MPRRQKPKGPPPTGNMWGLTESNLLEDNKALEVSPHSGYTDNMPAYPSSLEYSEKPYDYRPGGLHPIHIEDSLESGRYRVIHKLGYGFIIDCIAGSR